MSAMLRRPGVRAGLFYLAAGILLLGLLRYPEVSVQAARDGVDLCLSVIVPSLFPFFVLSSLCVDLGLLRGLERLLRPVMAPLFHVGGACAGAFLLGIVGGYPVGARTALSLYQSGQCGKTEAERMLSFCNNSGPAFILGVVGAGVLSSSTAGLWLYAAHVTASILVGLLFRFYHPQDLPGISPPRAAREPAPFSSAFTGAVTGGMRAALNICGFVIFFTVLIRLLFQSGAIPLAARGLTYLLGFLNLDRRWAETLLTGVIEMTSGVWSLRDMAGALGEKLCMAAFILGWAGLSVHCQVLSFIGSSGLSTRTYFLGKLLHGVLSAALVYGLSRLFHWNIPVSRYLATQVSAIAGLQFRRALGVSTISSLLILAILAGISLLFRAKASGNPAKNRV